MTFPEIIAKREESKTEGGTIICTFAIVHKFFIENIYNNEYIGFEALTAIVLKSYIFWEYTYF
jgi:hypothetical protein